MALLEMKNVNVLMTNKAFFFYHSAKDKHEKYIEIPRKNNYATKKIIKLLTSSNLLKSYWHRFIKVNKYDY